MNAEDGAALAHFFGTLQGVCFTSTLCILSTLLVVRTLCCVADFWSHLMQIRGLSKSLLAELEKRAKAWPSQTTLGDVFLPYIPMMKMFSVYINDYDDFLAMVAR